LTNIDYDTFEDRVKARTKKGIVTIRYLTSIINPFLDVFRFGTSIFNSNKKREGFGPTRPGPKQDEFTGQEGRAAASPQTHIRS
jgi:hypothetical protein